MVKEKQKTMAWILIALLIAGFVGYKTDWAIFKSSDEVTQETALIQQETALTTAQLSAAQCPDTDLTNITINLVNRKNTSASDRIGAQINYYKVVNGVAESDAFTTLANSSTSGIVLPCGEDWMARVLSSNADAGRNSKITDATGDGSISVEDGDIYFSTTGGAATITATGSIHGLLEFQSYDEQARAFLRDSASANNNTVYQATPADFGSSTDGTVALAVGVAGQVEQTINYRTITVDKDFNDRGYYVSVNASTSVYDVPTLRSGGAGGTTLTDMKGSIDTYCSRSYSGEEYVYFVDRDVPLNDKGQIYFSVFALSGVNPAATDDISLSWHGVGTYTSINGNSQLKIGACNDASTTADIFAVQRVSIDIQ